MSAFNWIHPPGIADKQEQCEWMGFVLWASTTGEWNVVARAEAGGYSVLVSSTMQTNGKDINEAWQRAQAAAIVQHSLRQ